MDIPFLTNCELLSIRSELVPRSRPEASETAKPKKGVFYYSECKSCLSQL